MGDARETEKDPDAFRTISEVADDLNLPQHVLRFWETRFPQIKPVKRAGGRRFYRPEDVDLLRGIRQLLYREGYTIKGVQKILKEQGIRHVQDIGVERDVAVMRSVPAERPATAQDGVIFGGLLGLLPRRRAKGQDEAEPGALPRDVELPLPFPDAEADRDLAEDHGEPVAPLPPRIQARAHNPSERHYDDGVYEERVYEEREFSVEPAPRREPNLAHEERLTQRPPQRRAYTPDEPPEMAPTRRAGPAPDAERRAAPSAPMADPLVASSVAPGAASMTAPAPSFAPERASRPGPLPQRRPTRGPAAHVSTAPAEAFDDPLLPFMHHEPPPAVVADPLEERIRRLKARDSGPPEEYLPPKLRQRSAPPHESAPLAEEQRAVAARQERSSADGRGAGSATAWPEFARAAAAAEQDLAAWHEHLRPVDPPEEVFPSQQDFWHDDEAAYATSEAEAEPPLDDAWRGSARDEPEVPDDEGPDAWSPHDDDNDDFEREPDDFAPEPEPEPSVTSYQVSAPVTARLGMASLNAAPGVGSAMRLPPSIHREAAMPSQPASARKVQAQVESAAPLRPVAPPQRSPAAPASEPAPRRVGPLTGPLEDDTPVTLPPAGSGPWGRGLQQPAGPRETRPPAPAAPAAPWHGQRGVFEEPAASAAPIDSYLPPHLRGEAPRVTGQGGVGQGGVQPLLSRDDVHRLQAALYELGECRRLLRDVTEPSADSTQV
uniref:MerR family transcriptional regulator n=1 Tax=Xanthobacter agilis TaxID=47492 RepID=UPI00372D6B95